MMGCAGHAPAIESFQTAVVFEAEGRIGHPGVLMEGPEHLSLSGNEDMPLRSPHLGRKSNHGCGAASARKDRARTSTAETGIVLIADQAFLTIGARQSGVSLSGVGEEDVVLHMVRHDALAVVRLPAKSLQDQHGDRGRYISRA